MLEMINNINSKLNSIVEDLTAERDELSSALNDVQEKINSKIDEAKGYKVSVDSFKEEMSNLEADIVTLEQDLQNLKDNYGNKGFDAIVEVGTKEINSKIVLKQKEISKQAQQINELTDKARTIKDLLINLKRDKEVKKEKLDSLNVLIEYYSGEFIRIADYSVNNHDSLVVVPAEEVAYDLDIPVIEDVVDDSPVFDEIASMDKEEVNYANNFEQDSDVVDLKVQVENSDFTLEKDDSSSSFDLINNDILDNNEKKLELNENSKIDNDLDINEDDNSNSNNDFSFDTINNIEVNDLFDLNLDDFQINNVDGDNTFDVKEEVNNTTSDNFEDTISSLFANEITNNEDIDFKKINDSIDREYENIFGNSDDINITDSKELFEGGTSTNIFDAGSLFGNVSENTDSINDSNIKEESLDDDIVNNFFMTNKLDFNSLNDFDKEYVRNIFSPISFGKVLDVLRKNDLNVDSVYSNVKLFEMNSSELDGMISKLLLSGQTKENINLVLATLPLIRLIDLNDVLESFGPDAVNANITDIIIKAKHLSDMGRNDN